MLPSSKRRQIKNKHRNPLHLLPLFTQFVDNLSPSLATLLNLSKFLGPERWTDSAREVRMSFFLHRPSLGLLYLFYTWVWTLRSDPEVLTFHQHLHLIIIRAANGTILVFGNRDIISMILNLERDKDHHHKTFNVESYLIWLEFFVSSSCSLLNFLK